MSTIEPMVNMSSRLPQNIKNEFEKKALALGKRPTQIVRELIIKWLKTANTKTNDSTKR